MANDRPTVAVFVETETGIGRTLLAGIGDYATRHRAWRIYMPRASGWTRQQLADLEHGGYAGVLARVRDESEAALLASLGCPAVNLTPEFDHPSVPTVKPDWPEVMRLGLSHFRERGIGEVAYFGFGKAYSRQRRAVLAGVLTESSARPLQSYLMRGWGPKSGQAWRRERGEVGAWLQALPRPLGVICSNDLAGRWLAEAAAEVGLHVPDDVAILGIHDDATICRLAGPPLSSIATDGWRIGYEAADRLTAMIEGRPVGERVRLVAPRGVVTRQSTEVFVCQDPVVTEAMRYIRTHASDPAGVEDVASHVHLSRRTLELRFRKAIGTTPGRAIIRQQVRHAKQLLVETDWSMEAVARTVGYREAIQFGRAFKREVGQAPSAYRKRHAVGEPTSD